MNKELVLSLADSQAESFIVMKKRISKETCMKIIEDFSHKPSCMNNLKTARARDRVQLEGLFGREGVAVLEAATRGGTLLAQRVAARCISVTVWRVCVHIDCT